MVRSNISMRSEAEIRVMIREYTREVLDPFEKELKEAVKALAVLINSRNCSWELNRSQQKNWHKQKISSLQPSRKRSSSD